MAYKLTIHFSDGTSTEEEEIFETEAEARDAYDDWQNDWAVGAEVLELAGESYSDKKIIDYDIDEV